MLDLSAVKLGLKRGPRDPNVPLLANYVDRSALAPAPRKKDWLAKPVAWGDLGNNDVGDCVIAAGGHYEQAAGAWNDGVPGDVTADLCLKVYGEVTGYDPKDPSTDQGTDPQVFYKWWSGNRLGSTQLAAWARIDPSDHELIREAITIFGFVTFSIGLPLTAQDDLQQRAPWRFHGLGGRGRPDGWGGHQVLVGAFDQDARTSRGNPGTLTCITWGQEQPMEQAFASHYVEAVQVPIAQAWVGQDGKSPDGLALADLLADAKLLG